MNNDDKQFVTDLVQGSVNDAKQELEEKIRHNGVMIEHLGDVIQSVAENNQVMMASLVRIEKRLDISQVDDVPSIKSAVKNHAKRIAWLEEVTA